MLQLVPAGNIPNETVDAAALYMNDERPPWPTRPWVVANMVASVDGATAVSGVSGGLAGPGDKVIFDALRASADWILVAAGTARAERYRIPTTPPELQAQRAALGRSRPPRLAVVTGSADIDSSLPMFADVGPSQDPVLVITGNDAPPKLVEELRAVAEVIVVDHPRPTPEVILGELAKLGAAVVLTEGGPTFLGQLVAADVVDEMCITLSPLLIGGDSHRIASGQTADIAQPLRLDRLLALNSMLFARYVRQR